MWYMDIKQQSREIYLLTDDISKAISEDDWAKATEIFQRRDEKIHQIFTNTEKLDDIDSQIVRDMILKLQNNDQITIEQLVLQRDKLLSDVLDASNSQKALKAYANNI